MHITWAAMALGLMAWGPARLSLDHLFWSEQRKGVRLAELRITQVRAEMEKTNF